MDQTTSFFFESIKKGDRLAVEALLAQNPELVLSSDTSGLSAVLTAAYYQQPIIVDFLIEHDAPLNLFEACAAGQLERVQEILDAAPDQKDAWAPDGFQPLGLACFFGHTAIVEFLLECGAEVNQPSRNPLGVQPLNSAVAGQHLQIARLLLEHSADPNIRQGEGFAPLHGAGQNGQIEMIHLLLEHGANPGVVNVQGKSPADLADEAGHPEAAALLRGS